MVNLTGLQPGPSAAESVLASGVSKAALAEDGFSCARGPGGAQSGSWPCGPISYLRQWRTHRR